MKVLIIHRNGGFFIEGKDDGIGKFDRKVEMSFRAGIKNFTRYLHVFSVKKANEMARTDLRSVAKLDDWQIKAIERFSFAEYAHPVGEGVPYGDAEHFFYMFARESESENVFVDAVSGDVISSPEWFYGNDRTALFSASEIDGGEIDFAAIADAKISKEETEIEIGGKAFPLTERRKGRRLPSQIFGLEDKFLAENAKILTKDEILEIYASSVEKSVRMRLGKSSAPSLG